MTLIEHFEELRTRLFIALGSWAVAGGAAFYFRDNLLEWLKAPLPPTVTLNAFRLLEAILISMQIAIFFGLILAAPVIVGQLWGFIAPGLYPEERRWAVPFVLGTALAFAGGVLFSYYAILPFALPVIIGFLPDEVQLILSIGDYISKIILYLAIFGFIFELPVLSFLLARLGFLYAPMLRQYRRYTFVGCWVVAAVITPTPDPLNLALVAVPLVLLYEVSIIVVRLSQRKVPSEREDSELTRPN